MTTSMVPVTADAVLANQPAADISDCCVVFEVPRFGSTRRSFASVCGGSVVVLNYDPMLINTCYGAMMSSSAEASRTVVRRPPRL